MIKRILLFTVFALSCSMVYGQGGNGPTGPIPSQTYTQLPAGSGGGGASNAPAQYGPAWVSLSPNCNGSNGCYFVNDNTKACFDITTTNTSPTITSAGQCTWTSADLGKKVFVTNGCNNGVDCGFISFAASKTIAPANQNQVAVIGTINSPTSITLACTGVATCSSPNATASVLGFAIVVYGTDDTTNLNTAWVAAVNAAAATNSCPHLQLPQGMMYFSAAIFGTGYTSTNLSPNICTSQAPAYVLNLSQMTLFAATIQGAGPGSTQLVPGPDMNWLGGAGGTQCGNSTGNDLIGGPMETYWKDLAVDGFGQSLNGAASPSADCVLIGSTNAEWFENVALVGWANRNSFTTGTNFNGYSFMTNSYVAGFGSTPIVASGAYTTIANSLCGLGGVRGCLSVNAMTGGQVQSTGNQFFSSGFSGNTTPMIEVVSGALVSVADSGQLSSGGTNFKVDNAASAYIVNFTNTDSTSSQTPLTIASGGTAYVSGWNPEAFAHTVGVSNAGTFYDQGGNAFGGPISGAGVSLLSSTSQVSIPTITGTGACATVGSQLPAATGVNPLSGSLACTGTSGAATLTFTWAAVAPHGYICPLPRDVTTGADVFTFTSSSATACVYGAAAIVSNDVITWGPVSPY